MKKTQETDQFNPTTVKQEMYNLWDTFAAVVEKSHIWILFQFCRGVADEPFPDVPFFGPVPQHALQPEDIQKADTVKEYNVAMFLDNFDFHMFGYFLKLLWLHYQQVIPSWVLDMHLMYVKDKEPGNVNTKEKRARLYSPEGLCVLLEKTTGDFGNFTPLKFGKILEKQFVECFQMDFLSGEVELPMQSMVGSRLILFKSLLHGFVLPPKHLPTSTPMGKKESRPSADLPPAGGSSSARKSDNYRPSERIGRVKRSAVNEGDSDGEGNFQLRSYINFRYSIHVRF
jgi:hypothetical protein